MRTPKLKVVAALVLSCGMCFSGAAFGQSAAAAKKSPAELDALAKRVIAEQHVVGASVLVAQSGKILLHAGYGNADLG
jgi:CubicO group peptidase (beta-lactamase class C family)